MPKPSLRSRDSIGHPDPALSARATRECAANKALCLYFALKAHPAPLPPRANTAPAQFDDDMTKQVVAGFDTVITRNVASWVCGLQMDMVGQADNVEGMRHTWSLSAHMAVISRIF
jgi:hypothetical protein